MTLVVLGSALLMGLLGSTHCVLMCGGVVSMACSALPMDRATRWRAQWPYVLSYNAGRIVSYAAGGAIAGTMGASLATFGVVERAQLALRLAAGALTVALGLYVAGVARAMRWVERAGAPLWRHVAKAARRFVPVRSPGQALALGLLWGWMPCGLVYAALAAAVTSGSAIGGAATMAAFGLGTLPMLVAMGSAVALVAPAARLPWVRVTAGVVLVGLGALQSAHAWAASSAAARNAPRTCCAHASRGH